MSVSRSVSQLKTYSQCPYRYYLERVADDVWQRPAAWLAQGTAVHTAAEARELSGRTLSLEDMMTVFEEAYRAEINKALDITPNLNYWFASGPYKGAEDIQRRRGIGLEQCANYIEWYDNHPNDVIWIAQDGTPGIEMGFNIDLDGVMVRGYIDQVLETRYEDMAHVRDLKTGNTPGDEFQLATYGVAIEEMYGVHVPTGDYWMARAGKPTYEYDLTEWPRNRVADEFNRVDQLIISESFDPDPEPAKCRFCSVAASCEFAL